MPIINSRGSSPKSLSQSPQNKRDIGRREKAVDPVRTRSRRRGSSFSPKRKTKATNARARCTDVAEEEAQSQSPVPGFDIAKIIGLSTSADGPSTRGRVRAETPDKSVVEPHATAIKQSRASTAKSPSKSRAARPSATSRSSADDSDTIKVATTTRKTPAKEIISTTKKIVTTKSLQKAATTKPKEYQRETDAEEAVTTASPLRRSSRTCCSSSKSTPQSPVVESKTKAPSPIKKAATAAKRSASPAKQTASPAKAGRPAKKIASPAKKTTSSAQKTTSTTKRAASPVEKAASPAKKVASPAERASGPINGTTIPAKKASSPRKRIVSPADNPSSPPKRQRRARADEAVPSVEQADSASQHIHAKGDGNQSRGPDIDPFHEPLPRPEIWHRNMPDRFPFGETRYVQEQISREMQAVLAEHDPKLRRQIQQAGDPPKSIWEQMKRAPWSLPHVEEAVVDGILEWNKRAQESACDSDRRARRPKTNGLVSTALGGKRERIAETDEEQEEDGMQSIDGGRKRAKIETKRSAAAVDRRKEEETRERVKIVGKNAEKLVLGAKQRKALMDERSRKRTDQEPPAPPGRGICVVM